MSLFDVFKGNQMEDVQQEEKDFFSVKYPTHTKGAVFMRLDEGFRNIIASNIAGQLEKMKVNLCPILEALGMLTKENLYKYSGLESRDLKKALKEGFTKKGGSVFVIDELMKSEEYRHKFTYCPRPSKDYWVCIELQEATEEQREWYGCSIIPTMDANKLNPFFEVWLSGRQLEKYKEYKKLIEELNKFFENGATRELINSYFGNVEFKGSKITENQELFRCGFSMSGVIKY